MLRHVSRRDAWIKGTTPEYLRGVILVPLLDWATPGTAGMGCDSRNGLSPATDALGGSRAWGLFKASRMTDVKWCHPRLAVEVKHLAGSKTLRHATVTRIVQ